MNHGTAFDDAVQHIATILDTYDLRPATRKRLYKSLAVLLRGDYGFGPHNTLHYLNDPDEKTELLTFLYYAARNHMLDQAHQTICSVDYRDERADQGDFAALVCTPEYRARHAG